MNKKVYAAGVVIIDKDNNVLLLQRHINHKDSRKWAVPGGSIEEGETPLEAAAREVFEETGINLKGKEVRFFKDYHWNIWELDINFAAHVCYISERPETITMRPLEHTAYEWTPIGVALERTDLALGLNDILRDSQLSY
ncbi:MAG: NUDIX hydrolase [Gammaproteobacteria bacterium]|nr:NUDIX hydrolase [Gammaproteobacteria bacterium]